MRANINNTILLTLLFSAGCSALCTKDKANPNQDTTTITPAQILEIAPESASCVNPDGKGECATVDTAADAITASLKRYKVSSREEQAAVIGLIAFESVEFQFNRKQPPNVVPGQGSMLPSHITHTPK